MSKTSKHSIGFPEIKINKLENPKLINIIMLNELIFLDIFFYVAVITSGFLRCIL